MCTNPSWIPAIPGWSLVSCRWVNTLAEKQTRARKEGSPAHWPPVARVAPERGQEEEAEEGKQQVSDT